MGYGILCQGCGIEAPTKYVEFRQNIGALVMRFHRTVRGNLCKNCVHKNFWKMTGTTLAIGWLGYISIIVAPIFIIMNICRYVGAASMPKVPKEAARPVVDNDVIQRVYPLLGEIQSRLNMQQKLADIARELAPKANVTPGQLCLYVQHLSRQRAAAAAPPLPMTGGFPVVQQQPPPRAPVAR